MREETTSEQQARQQARVPLVRVLWYGGTCNSTPRKYSVAYLYLAWALFIVGSAGIPVPGRGSCVRRSTQLARLHT